MRKTILCGAVMTIMAGTAMAEPLDGRTARAQLFSPRGAQVELRSVEGVSAEEAALLQKVAKDYEYYAAVAIAPDEDLLKSEATMLVANQHSTEAAEKIALNRCNKLRKGGRKCAVVAVIRPGKYQPRALTLSAEATRAMAKDYGNSGRRAMAISPSTGAWAVAKGNAAQRIAMSSCAAKGMNDCIIVAAD
ncbi:MAG: 5-aminolevulic acid synthase [Pseudorhodobacter sp.]